MAVSLPAQLVKPLYVLYRYTDDVWKIVLHKGGGIDAVGSYKDHDDAAQPAPDGKFSSMKPLAAADSAFTDLMTTKSEFRIFTEKLPMRRSACFFRTTPIPSQNCCRKNLRNFILRSAVTHTADSSGCRFSEHCEPPRNTGNVSNTDAMK